jgi:hypothetical protein
VFRAVIYVAGVCEKLRTFWFKKIKLFRYTPCGRLRGEEVYFLLFLDLGTRRGQLSA